MRLTYVREREMPAGGGFPMDLYSMSQRGVWKACGAFMFFILRWRFVCARRASTSDTIRKIKKIKYSYKVPG